MRLRDRMALFAASRIAKRMTPARRIAFYGLRTFSLSDVVLFPASAPSSRRLLRAFPFSFRCGRTRRVFSNGRFISVVKSGIGAPSVEISGNLVCKGGAKVIVRLDFCGALSAEVGVGDIFIASSARGFDQVSRHYFDHETIPADSHLVSLFEQRLTPLAERAGIPLHVGQICTVDLFFAQTDEMLREWGKSGEAVDMETAAVYAISRSYGVASVAVMVVTDNKLLGHAPYSDDVESLKKIVDGHALLTGAVRRIMPALIDLARTGSSK